MADAKNRPVDSFNQFYNDSMPNNNTSCEDSYSSNCNSDFSFISFNMHGVTQGISLLSSFCCEAKYDVIFLQELWLTTDSLYMISLVIWIFLILSLLFLRWTTKCPVAFWKVALLAGFVYLLISKRLDILLKLNVYLVMTTVSVSVLITCYSLMFTCRQSNP